MRRSTSLSIFLGIFLCLSPALPATAGPSAPPPGPVQAARVPLGHVNPGTGSEDPWGEGEPVPNPTDRALAGAVRPGDVAVSRATAAPLSTTAVVPPATIGVEPSARLSIESTIGNLGADTVDTSRFDPYQWPMADLTPPQPGYPRTDSGVRVIVVGGIAYDHPVFQGQLALWSLHQYGLTKDAAELERARVNAQRLYDTAVVSRGAWFFPYTFSFRAHGRSDTQFDAPWYSGMAQGVAASLFYRMYAVTGETRWRDAGNGALNALMLSPRADAPWVSWIDPDGRFWSEWGARQPVSDSERIINAHMYAMVGFLDAYQVTRDPQLLPWIRAGLQTSYERFVGYFRTPGWLSRYCFRHSYVETVHYHEVHERAFRTFFDQIVPSAGSARFARMADLLHADYPTDGGPSTVRFRTPGTYPSYTFDESGRILTTRTTRLTQPSTAPASTRVRIKGRGIYYVIGAGALAGRAVPEGPTVFATTAQSAVAYSRPRRAVISAGSRVSVYRYASTGLPASSATTTAVATTSWTVDRRAWFLGRPNVHLTSGPYAGSWLPEYATVSIR